MKLKGYNNSFNSWIAKKDINTQCKLFSRTYKYNLIKMKVELDLSNYEAKSDLKGEPRIDTF